MPGSTFPLLGTTPGLAHTFTWNQIESDGRRLVNAAGEVLLGPATNVPNTGATGSAANPIPIAPLGAARAAAARAAATPGANDEYRGREQALPRIPRYDPWRDPPLERDAQVQMHCQALLLLSRQYHAYYHRALHDMLSVDADRRDRAAREVEAGSAAAKHIAGQLQYFLGPATNYPFSQR